MAGTCFNGLDSTTECDAGGSADVCSATGILGYTCDLNNPGTGNAGTVSAIKNGSNWEIWGTAGNGSGFCCIASPNTNGIDIYGTNYSDTMDLQHTSGGITYNMDNLHGAGITVRMFGRDGGDFMYGSDITIANGVSEKQYGGGGPDYMEGRAGDDELYGDEDDDQCYGNDLINGDAHNDILDGEGHDDTVCGGGHADSVYGDVGDDTLWACTTGGICDGSDTHDGGSHIVGDACRDHNDTNCESIYYIPSTSPPTGCR